MPNFVDPLPQQLLYEVHTLGLCIGWDANSLQWFKDRGINHSEVIPRPPNQFMIFRAVACSLNDRNRGEHASTFAKRKWNTMLADSRELFLHMANLLKKCHNFIFPGYRYKPGARTKERKCIFTKKQEKNVGVCGTNSSTPRLRTEFADEAITVPMTPNTPTNMHSPTISVDRHTHLRVTPPSTLDYSAVQRYLVTQNYTTQTGLSTQHQSVHQGSLPHGQVFHQMQRVTQPVINLQPIMSNLKSAQVIPRAPTPPSIISLEPLVGQHNIARVGASLSRFRRQKVSDAPQALANLSKSSISEADSRNRVSEVAQSFPPPPGTNGQPDRFISYSCSQILRGDFPQSQPQTATISIANQQGLSLGAGVLQPIVTAQTPMNADVTVAWGDHRKVLTPFFSGTNTGPPSRHLEDAPNTTGIYASAFSESVTIPTPVASAPSMTDTTSSTTSLDSLPAPQGGDIMSFDVLASESFWEDMKKYFNFE